MAANPDVSPPVSPGIQAVSTGYHPSPEPDSSTSTLPADVTNDDVPMHFPARSPSPPLPDLKRRPFPPDEASDDDLDDASDDEVVARLPIYMSTSLYPNVQMFQYPLNTRTISAPSWAIDRGKTITTRVKEAVGRVEVEVPVDAGQSVWREERARDLGYVQDVNELNGSMDLEGGARSRDKKSKGKEKDEKKKEKKWGDKMRMRSEVVPNATGYYSGMIHDGALHLHPISRYLQLRTSLQYLDDVRASRPGEADEAPGQPRPGLPPTAGLAGRTLKIEDDNDGSGSIKDFRTKMWTSAQKEQEDEWIPYEWHENEHPAVLDKLSTMILPPEKQRRLACSTKGLDYLDKA